MNGEVPEYPPMYTKLMTAISAGRIGHVSFGFIQTAADKAIAEAVAAERERFRVLVDELDRANEKARHMGDAQEAISNFMHEVRNARRQGT